MPKHIVATVAEIPPGEVKIVDLAGRSIGIYNIDGEFFAIRNRCPHQGGPLCLGRIAGFLTSDRPGHYAYTRKGQIQRCPWHGWEYDIKTGQSWVSPGSVRVRSYEVGVETEDGAERIEVDPETGYIKGPFKAETYPVSVEKLNVVIDLP